MSEDIKRLTLRIPVELYDQIEKLAKEDKRNINNYITIVLEKHANQYFPKSLK